MIDQQADARGRTGRTRRTDGAACVRPLTSTAVVMTWLMITGACGGAADQVHPDDMSAAQHRQEAAREQRAADRETEKYDSRGISSYPGRPPSGRSEDYIYGPSVYDPDAHHLRNANTHRAHAAEHERAAAELERFEEAECKDFPPATRASCPLLGPATAITDIDGGVRVELAQGVSVVAVVALMRCHLAYARSRGFADAADCPIYLRGIDIRATSDGKGVQITSQDPATAALVRWRAREEAVRGSPTI